MVQKQGIGLGIIVIIITAFLLVNAKVAFGAEVEAATTLLTLFLILGTAFLTLSIAVGRTPELLTASLFRLMPFLIGFFVTAVIVIIIPAIFGASFLASFSRVGQAISFGFTYAFVIAFWEELIFRDILPKSFGISDILSNMAFAAFHVAALTAAIGFTPFLVLAFGVLFALGMIWAFMRDRFGIMSSVGSHVAYNLAVFSPATLAMIVVFVPV